MSTNIQDRLVYVYNKTRETFVATEAVVADSYLRRLIGLLGKPRNGRNWAADSGLFRRLESTRSECCSRLI